MSPQQKRMESWTFISLLLCCTLAFLWILIPFFGPIFWALALAIIFHPLHCKLLKKLNGRKNLAAGLCLLVSVFVLVIPVVATTVAVTAEIMDFYEKAEQNDGFLQGHMQSFNAALSVAQEWGAKVGVNLEGLKAKLTSAVSSSGQAVAKQMVSAGKNILSFAVGLGVMLYVAFFMLRDGERIVDKLMQSFPLRNDREELLCQKLKEVVRATIKGNLVIAIIQGALGGVIFAVLGIPGALIWGVVMVCASLLPAIGAGIVWLPVAIGLIIAGEVWKGVVLILFGAVVIGLVDNLLRPILVGRDTKLPDYIVLISTLGGISLLGVNGFVMGPVIAAMFFAVWGIFLQDYGVDSDPATNREASA